MTGRTSLTIVLAAGEGTRMRSSQPKVLHPVASQSLLAHVLGAVPKGTGAATAVVIGPNHEAVAAEVARLRPDAATYIQRQRLGTAHAVLAHICTRHRQSNVFARSRCPCEGASVSGVGFWRACLRSSPPGI